MNMSMMPFLILVFTGLVGLFVGIAMFYKHYIEQDRALKAEISYLEKDLEREIQDELENLSKTHSGNILLQLLLSEKISATLLLDNNAGLPRPMSSPKGGIYALTKSIVNSLLSAAKVVLSFLLVTRDKDDKFVTVRSSRASSVLVTGAANTVAMGQQSVLVNQKVRNDAVEVREVVLDLSLNGNYPTRYWIETPRGEVMDERWTPLGYNYDKLKEVLLKAIGEWGKQGWEVVETDLDDLWVFERTCRITRRLFHRGVHKQKKCKQVFYGAKFHVKRKASFGN